MTTQLEDIEAIAREMHANAEELYSEAYAPTAVKAYANRILVALGLPPLNDPED